MTKETDLIASDKAREDAAIYACASLRDKVRTYWNRRRKENRAPPIEWGIYEGRVD